MGNEKTDSDKGWLPEVEELRLRETLASQMGGEENLARHRAAGRLNVRERIDRLLDKGSFHETGAITGIPTFDGDRLVQLFPSNFILGTGRIDRRRVVVGADDFTIRGGAADAAIGHKAAYAERMALELRLPMVRLVDGTGGGGSVKFLEQMDRTYVPYNPGMDTMAELLSTVPVASAALGSVAGLGAARVVFSHFSVMPRKTAQLFVAGPPVVEPALGRKVGKEELGGSQIQTGGFGAVDNEVASEEEAFEQIRRFLSYLPDSVYELPPVQEASDPADRREEELVRIIPKNKRRPYPVRRLLTLVLDQGSFFEIGANHGRSVVTGLARLSGRPVGVFAHDSNFFGGAITAQGADKLTRFIDLCDTFHLPVVNFVDNPGFMIGVEAEKQGTIRFGARYHLRRLPGHGPLVLHYSQAGLRGGRGGPRQPLPPQPALCLAFGRVGFPPYRGRRPGRLPASDRSLRRSPGPAPGDRTAFLQVHLALPHSRKIRYRGDHRSPRHPAAALRMDRDRLSPAAWPARAEKTGDAAITENGIIQAETRKMYHALAGLVRDPDCPGKKPSGFAKTFR